MNPAQAGAAATVLTLILASSVTTADAASRTSVSHAAVRHAPGPAAASGPCQPDAGCIRLGDPTSTSLTTINNAGLNCTIHFTVTWGDGSAPDHATVPPESQVIVSHTYKALGTFTEKEAATVDPSSDAGCFTIPGGWDRQTDIQVIPRVTATAMLKDIDNLQLKYLSTDQHPYFEGSTRINGTITVKGAVRDRLSFLELEVSQGNTQASAFLTDAATAELIDVPFGADKKVSIDATKLLFELPAGAAALFNNNLNGPVHLRLVGATAGDFAQIDKSLGDVERLVRYKRANRYGPRDTDKGGDDWVRPSVRPVLIGLSITFPELDYGDISNMNGGNFDPPHKTHQGGLDADVKIPGYAARDATVAHKLISYLNDPHNGSRIEFIYVTYNKPGGVVFPGRPNPDPFWEAIKDVTLNDGRAARAVIRPLGNHDTHFHWRITP